MSTDIYRTTTRQPVDPAEEERELLALGEKTGLFPSARQRHRAIAYEVFIIAIGVAIMAGWGVNVLSLQLTVVAIISIVTIARDPAARRRAVQRAVREAPVIEPPLRKSSG